MIEQRDIAVMALRKAFAGIPASEVERILSSGRIAEYPASAVLCKEGAVEDKFYVLLEGEVQVTKRIDADEERLLKELSPGDFFGEMAIIHNAPRAATVRTTKKVSVLEISKEAFEKVLTESSSVSLAMVREVSRRLRENDEMAIEDLRVKAGELATAYQQLAELELARREFLTTIAHELRTPLTSAGGFMQVVRMGMMEGEQLQSALETVARNIEHITTLMNDILFLQEMDLILSDFGPIDLGQVVSAAVDEKRAYAEASGVAMKLAIAPDLPKVLGDAKNLQRAFAAIVDNAIKFSDTGGRVTVTVDHNPSYLWVRIQDEGIGIPPEILPKIYDRFFRVEEFDGRLFGGVGIGLSIAQQVIRQHEGEIEVGSKVGDGSKFTVRLKPAPEESSAD
jgi:signal transduction histidine kinase